MLGIPGSLKLALNEDKKMKIKKTLGLLAVAISVVGTTQVAAQASQPGNYPTTAVDFKPVTYTPRSTVTVTATPPIKTTPITATNVVSFKNHFFFATTPGSNSSIMMYGPGQSTSSSPSYVTIVAKGYTPTAAQNLQNRNVINAAGANMAGVAGVAAPLGGVVAHQATNSTQAHNAVNSTQVTQATQAQQAQESKPVPSNTSNSGGLSSDLNFGKSSNSSGLSSDLNFGKSSNSSGLSSDLNFGKSDTNIPVPLR